MDDKISFPPVPKFAPIPYMSETLNKSGANIIAAKIKAAWMDLGIDVDVWVECIGPIHSDASRSAWAVRSNMINGIPPKKSP